MASNTGNTAPERTADPATTINALATTTASPTTPPSPSAASRVAGIPELLEMILLNLSPNEKELCSFAQAPDVRSLLLSQLTSQAFRDTVKGSPKIQRVLSGAKFRKEFERFTKKFEEEMAQSIRTAMEEMRRAFGLS